MSLPTPRSLGSPKFHKGNGEESSVAIAAQPAYTDDQVVHLKVSWSAYEALVESLGDNSHVRLTYDGEILEIMSPGSRHDFLASLLGDMLASVRLEWRIELTSYRSTTFRADKPTRGFEGDQSYYVGDLKTRIRDVWNVDIAIDPPPDLVVEIDITNSSTNKFPTFVRLGVPEVWHYTPQAFVWHALEGGAYAPITTSRTIKGLPLVEVEKRIATAQPGDTLALLAEWQQWLRNNRHLHESA
jgi:Uma2 family endonuclease